MISFISKEEREIIKRFQIRSAFNVHLSLNIDSINVKNGLALNKLISKGIIVRVTGGAYYLDEQKLMEYNLKSVKWGMSVLLLVLIFIMLFYFYK